jgi:hypothetical protein
MKYRYTTATVYDNDFTWRLGEAVNHVFTTASGDLDPEQFKKFVVKATTFYSDLHHIGSYANPELDIERLQHIYKYLLDNIKIEIHENEPRYEDENGELVVFDHINGEFLVY